MSGQEDQRIHARFEPPLLDAIVRLQNAGEMRGCVLDSSERGMAIALPKGAQLPPVGTLVEVSIRNAASIAELLFTPISCGCPWN